MVKDEYTFSSYDFNQVDDYHADLLFLSKKFLDVQHTIKKRHFSISFQGGIILTLTFSIVDQIAKSPFKAPFGGLNVINDLPTKVLQNFILFFQEELKVEGIKSISISFPPLCYHSNVFDQIQLFLKSGWELDHTEIGFYLEVNVENGFWLNLHAGSKNKFNKAKKAGFHCEKLDIEKLEDAFEILVSNRVRNGFPVTMKLQDLNFMLRHFKEYELFAAYDADKMISMAICIQVSNEISYLFYLADLHEYRSYSPNIIMLNYIYDYFITKGTTTLDLGLVSENSIINKGLFNFKKNLGGSLSKKYDLIKFL